MKKKTLKEAGNYSNLTQGEKVMLGSLQDPNIRNAIANVVSQFRAKGKKIDPVAAAEQIMQIPHFQSDKQAVGMLQQFVSTNKNLTGLANLQQNKSQKPDPFGLNRRPQVPMPPQLVQQQQGIAKSGAAPFIPGPTPADQFEKLRTSNTNNDEILAQQSGRSSGVPEEDFKLGYEFQKQREAQNPAAASSSQNFHGAKAPGLTNFKAQKGIPKTRISTNPNMGANLNATIPAKRGQPVNPLGKTIAGKRLQTNEAFETPMAFNSTLKNVMSTIQRLKPEELKAIAGLVTNLMQQGTGTTTMEHKKIVTEVLKYKIQEQINARNTAAKLISEGPMANIWDKIKGAGSALGQQMGLGGQMGQQAQQVGVDENAKRASQELTKTLGKVNQFRSKFNSSTLKNAEAMNGYHDLVLNAVQMYQQYQNVLGPFGQQLVRQIHDAVGNLVYDLTSEKEHIDAFLKQLKQAGMADINTTSLGKQAKKRADVSRVEENPGGGASLRRNMPMGGAAPRSGKQLDDEMMQRQTADFEQHLGPRSAQGESDFQKLYSSFTKDFKNKKKPSKKAPAKKKKTGKK